MDTYTNLALSGQTKKSKPETGKIEIFENIFRQNEVGYKLFINEPVIEG